MTFDPLGHFRAVLAAPFDLGAVAAARTFLPLLPDCGAPTDRDNGIDPGISRIYGHWSCQGQGSIDSAYNAVVEKVGGVYAIRLSTDPRKNARAYDQHGDLLDLEPGYGAHTYHRNTGGFGIAIDGMDGAGVGPHDFGADPVTVEGITYLCAAVAAVATKYQIDIAGLSLDADPFYGETSFLTHGEAAHFPGTPAAYEPYFLADHPSDGDSRWDLSSFVPVPAGVDLTFAHAQMCGDAIRTVAHRIKLAMADAP